MRILCTIIFLYYANLILAQENQIPSVDSQNIHKEITSFNHDNWELDKVLKVKRKKKLTDKISSVTFGSDSMGAIVNEKGEVLNTYQGKIEKCTNHTFLIKHNEKLRIIDLNGNFTTKDTYDSIESLHQNNFLEVSVNNKKGMLDKFGKEIIPLIDFCEPKFSMKEGRSRKLLSIEKLSKPYLEAINKGEKLPEYYLFTSESGYGIKDRKGEILIPAEYRYLELPSSDRVLVHDGKLYGYLNMKNKLVIDFQFTEAKRFQCGRAKVSISDTKNYDIKRKYGFINQEGKIVIDYKYEKKEIGEFYKNYAIFKKGNLQGFIDKNGNIKVEPKYTRIDDFIEPGIAEAQIGDKIGYIKANGEIFIPIEYRGINTKTEQVSTLNGSYIRKVKNVKYYKLNKNAKKGVCDASGKIIIPVEQEYIEDNLSNYIKISNGDRSYCIDENFNQILREDTYVGLTCRKQFGEIEIKGKSKKFFYPKNEEAITKYYDRLYSKKPGFFFAVVKDSTAIIDSNHNILLPFAPNRKYQKIISSDLVVVQGPKLYVNHGIEDFKGNLLFPHISNEIESESENYFSILYKGQLAYFKRI